MYLWRIKIKETGRIWLHTVYRDGRTFTMPYYPLLYSEPQPKFSYKMTFLDFKDDD